MAWRDAMEEWRLRYRAPVLALALVLCGCPAARAAGGNILILYSAQFGLPGYNRTNDGLWPVLRTAGVRADAVFSEYLDLGRNPGQEYRDRLADFLKQKYGSRKIDVILAISTTAAAFVLDERYRLFEGVPVIASLPSLNRLPGTAIHPLVILGDHYDIAGTVEDALHILPDTANVLVIDGVSAFDQVQERSAREQLKPWEGKLRITYLSGLSERETIRRVADPPPKTVILYLGVFQDAAGENFTPDEYLRAVSPAARAPIFTIQDGWLDAGVVGGSMTSFKEDGAAAGRLALRIMKGEPLLHVPPAVISTPNRAMFQWEQLQRWGLDESNLPPGSLVVGQPVSIYAQHPAITLVTLAFLGLESLLIAALLWHRRQKRIAAGMLHESEEKFRKFFTNIPDYCYILSRDGVIRDANPAALHALGYQREELLGRPVLTIYAETAQAKARRLIAAWQQTGELRNEEMTIVSKDGRERTVLLSAAAVRDDQNRIAFSTCVQTDITDRKQAEEALREREELLRQAEVLGQFGSSWWDVATDTTTWSEGLYRIAGRDRHLPAPRHEERAALYAPESWARLDMAAKRAMASGEPYDLELELIRPDGERRWTRAIGVPLRDASGRIVHLQGTLQDITAGKQAADALRQARESLEALIESTDDLIWSADRDFRTVAFNAAARERLWRLFRLDLRRGATLDEFMPPEIAAEWKAMYERAMREGSFKTERRFADGGTVELMFHRISDGDTPIGLSVFGKDITERKRAEDALRESEERFRSAFEFASIGMALVAPDGRWLRVNQSLCQIVGYSEEELLARDYQSITHPDDLETDMAYGRRLLDSSIPACQLEKRYIHKNGRIVWVLLSISSVRDGRGGPLYFIAQIQDITERKQTEKRLLREKTFTDAIIDSVPGLFYLLDERGRALRWNRRAEEVTGYSTDEAARMKPADFIQGPDQQAVADTWRKVFTEGHAALEANLVLKDGTSVPYYLSAARVSFEGENFLIGNGIDISALKRAERALRESEEKFAKAFQNSPVIMTITTLKEGRCLEVNSTFERITGWRRSEVVGRARSEVRIRTSDAEMREAYRHLFSEGRYRDMDFTLRTRSGEERIMRLSAETIEFGGEACVLTVGQDITEQKSFEQQLRRLNESLEQRVKDRTAELERAVENLQMLSQAVENGPAIVVITDPEGLIEYVNPRFCEVTGYTREEVVARRPGIIRSGVHPRDFYEQLWNTIRSGETWRGEFCNRRKNGELYWESACISTVHDAGGAPRHYVAIKEDITELKQAAEELKRAKEAADAASRAKTAFLASMSHEIRTPMHAILGYSQLMLSDESISPQTRDNLRIVKRSGEHLLALITDVLEMAKIESGRAKAELAAFDLPNLLRDMTAMFRLRTARKGIEFSVVQDKSVPARVTGDEGKVRQILINLLGNAVKFTAMGHIVLRASTCGDKDRTRLVIEVEDSGVGIDPSEMDKLFRAFEQTKSGQRTQSGTGLGLAISKEYAHVMGGDISVASTPGQGSIFRLELPLDTSVVQASAEGSRAATAALAPGQEARRVLVADDDETDRGSTVRLLRMTGLEARECASGHDAAALCETWKPHLVLLNIRLADVDGGQAVRAIQATAARQGFKLIALSADCEDGQAAAREAGIDDFLAKPLSDPVLLQKVALHLGMRYREAESGEPTEPYAIPVPLTAESLSTLPAEVTMEMRQAILTGDMERFTRVLLGVAERNSPVADGLRDLADRYDYDALAKLLQ